MTWWSVGYPAGRAATQSSRLSHISSSGRGTTILTDRLPVDDGSRRRDGPLARAANHTDFHEPAHGRSDPFRGCRADDAHLRRAFFQTDRHNLKAECVKTRNQAREGVTARLELEIQTMFHGVLQKRKTPAARRQQG